MFILSIYISIIMSSWKRISSTLSTHFLNEVINMSWIICLLSQNISTSCNLFDKSLFLFPLTHFNAFLDYIVTISILHHLVKSTVQILACFILIITIQKFINDIFFVFLTAILKTFFYYIASELMVAKINYFPFNTLDNLIFVFLIFTMLQDMLDNIVSKLILYEIIQIF